MNEAYWVERLKRVAKTKPSLRARMKQGVIGLVLLATSCATAPQPERSYVFWDSDIESLVEAAHACGLQDVEMTFLSFRHEGEERHMVPSVFIPVRPSDPAFRCTMDWIRAHPETGLRVPS